MTLADDLALCQGCFEPKEFCQCPAAERACPPHTFEPQPDGDACIEPGCGILWTDWVRGFGLKTSTFQMPPSRQHRKKSAVAKRFGKAFGDGD